MPKRICQVRVQPCLPKAKFRFNRGDWEMPVQPRPSQSLSFLEIMMKHTLQMLAVLMCSNLPFLPVYAGTSLFCDWDDDGTYDVRDLIELHRDCSAISINGIECDMDDDGRYSIVDLVAIHRECKSATPSYCDVTTDWPDAWETREQEVVALINAARARGGDCGSMGQFPPSAPLKVHPALTCSTRVHSLDMAEEDYFSHTNPEGHGPGWRMEQAGYDGTGWGENIAAGYSTPEAVVAGWLESDGHCANMLEPSFQDMGIGYAYGSTSTYGHYWTLNLGR